MKNKNIKTLKLNNMEIIFNFENSTINNNIKTIKVEQDFEYKYTFFIKKTKIIAKDGIAGLYNFLKKIADDPEHFMYCYYKQIYNNI